MMNILNIHLYKQDMCHLSVCSLVNMSNIGRSLMILNRNYSLQGRVSICRLLGMSHFDILGIVMCLWIGMFGRGLGCIESMLRMCLDIKNMVFCKLDIK